MKSEYDAEQHRLYARISGPLTRPAMVKLRNNMLDSPYMAEGLSVIFDLRDTHVAMDVEELRQHAADDVRVGPALHGVRVAVLVAADADYGLIRMFETFSELQGSEAETGVFKDPEAAVRWLDDSYQSSG